MSRTTKVKEVQFSDQQNIFEFCRSQEVIQVRANDRIKIFGSLQHISLRTNEFIFPSPRELRLRIAVLSNSLGGVLQQWVYNSPQTPLICKLGDQKVEMDVVSQPSFSGAAFFSSATFHESIVKPSDFHPVPKRERCKSLSAINGFRI